MKRSFLTAAALLGLFATTFAQRIDKPTLTPKPCSEAQKVLVQQGIALHDRKDFDGAIAKYKQVLDETPDCTTAIYELALSYYGNSNTTLAMETAYKGSKYKSDD